MLSFDEFRAINSREKAKSSVGNDVKKPINDVNNKPVEKVTAASPSWTSSIGAFLELYSMQSIYIIFLVLDTFAAFMEIYISCKTGQIRSLKPVAKLLQSFLRFTTLLFSIEIFLVYVAFGTYSVFHLGYLTDLVVLSLQLVLDSRGRGSETHLLNIFRLWRPLRLLNALVANEQEKGTATKQQLAQLELELQNSQNEISGLKEEVTKEKEIKLAVENMLQNYKEEVDTLNEALKIAAMDIAEVGQADDDLFTSEDEEADEEEEDTIVSNTKSSSKANSSVSTSRNKVDIGQAEHKMDSESVRSKKDSSIVDTAAAISEAFVIHEDGRFERK